MTENLSVSFLPNHSIDSSSFHHPLSRNSLLFMINHHAISTFKEKKGGKIFERISSERGKISRRVIFFFASMLEKMLQLFGASCLCFWCH
jgi:hypothetical protein